MVNLKKVKRIEKYSAAATCLILTEGVYYSMYMHMCSGGVVLKTKNLAFSSYFM